LTLTFVDQVLATSDDALGTEAAWKILCEATSLDDALHLLDVLDLTGVEWRWDPPRVTRVLLAHSRHHQVFSAATIRAALPERAWPPVAGAIRAMLLAGLAEPTGRMERSAAAGAKGSLVRQYRLTPAGAALAARCAPAHGEIQLASLNSMGAPS
jgi:hypothetical protein